MSMQIADLCKRMTQAATVTRANIMPITGAVRDAEGGVAGLPPVVRGLVSSAVSREVARNTGQDIPAWTGMLAALSAALDEVTPVAARVEGMGTVGAQDRAALLGIAEHVEAAIPYLERLVVFMERAPAKVRRVPPTIVPVARREAFLHTLEEQAQGIRRALAAMPALCGDLRALAHTAL